MQPLCIISRKKGVRATALIWSAASRIFIDSLGFPNRKLHSVLIWQRIARKCPVKVTFSYPEMDLPKHRRALHACLILSAIAASAFLR